MGLRQPSRIHVESDWTLIKILTEGTAALLFCGSPFFILKIKLVYHGKVKTTIWFYKINEVWINIAAYSGVFLVHRVFYSSNI